MLQKCTELGVSHFIPILSDRTEKTGFDEDRARKIVIEASEQCGRSDIPKLRDPMRLETALEEYKDKIKLYYAEQSQDTPAQIAVEAVGIFVGPEGGWTDQEKQQLDAVASKMNIAQFTLRAETACVAAVSVVLV